MSSVYANPLIDRYASRAMAELWSEERRVLTWRSLWIALAEAERELGLPITEEQIIALRAAEKIVDFSSAREYERRFRHDVMAHVHAYGDAAPAAKGVIHLGATSCYVTDNGDLIAMRKGLDLIAAKLAKTIDNLRLFALQHRDLPTLGFTHFQPAQLTTVGKRACLWMYDLCMDIEEVERQRDGLRLRGAKGTTGTQASFLSLFMGDHEKVRELDRRIAAKFDFPGVYPVTGQTYSRKIDSYVLDSLGGMAQYAHKLATDLRLLAHRREVEEPFEKEQIGSSAMPYKRNPMRSERICALSRYLSAMPGSAAQTASTQWFERTLDDSAHRRLVIPQSFLCADAVLRLLRNVTSGLVVHEKVIARNVQTELPFLATENSMMSGVLAGGDRQHLHERIRVHSLAASDRIKREGAENDLLERLRSDPVFEGIDFSGALNPRDFVGRAPEQVDEFIAEYVEPILDRYREKEVDEEAIAV